MVDPVLPTADMLNSLEGGMHVGLDDYKSDITTRMATAWKDAQVAIQKAPAKQKHCYDRHKKAALPCVAEGDRVMLYVPSENNGKAYKFSQPFRGLYRVIWVFLNGVELILISKPAASSIRVSLDKVRRCPVEFDGRCLRT